MGTPAIVLFLGANPSNETRLALSREVREIDACLLASKHRDAFKLEQAWAVRSTDLQACLQRYEPAIVHFSGHGSAAGELLLEDHDGYTKPVPATALADLFRITGSTIRCVILNACYSEMQARAIAEHVDVVVGMTDAVDDKAAIAFAEGFYRALGYGQTVQTAFELGRSQIRLTDLPGADVPRLLVRAGVDAGAVKLAKEVGGSSAPSPAPRSTTGAHTMTASSLVAALHQLRLPPADFTGREAELRDLRAKLGARGAIIAGLTGQGGVGKTALALRLAAELRLTYPDAQLDVDLRGVDAEPLAPAAVMAEVIRAFEPEAKLPEGLDALGKVYRSVLDGKRALLLFDNARDRAQVESLLPPPSCLLLITSRQNFALPGLYLRRLDTLGEVEAVALIRSITPRLDEGTAAELAKLCGYLPLALRAAASTVAEEDDLSVAEYLSRLQSAEERLKLDRVEAVLHESAALLEEPARALWLRLGIMPADFDASAAAAIGGLELPVAGPLLRKLRKHSLLDWDEAAERYRVHDLARDYARSQLSTEERRVAERRNAKHFLRIAVAANARYLKGGEGVMKAFRSIDREWPHIAAAQEWAATHAGSDNDAARVCCDLPLAARALYIRRQHPREQIAWLNSALAAARRLGLRSHEGAALGSLGTAYLNLGEVHKAIEFFEQDLAIARELGDRHGEAQALGSLGNAYTRLGALEKVLDLFERRLAVARETGDRRGEANTLGRLGVAYAQLGDARQAMALYQQYLTIACEIGDRIGESIAHGNIGNVYRRLGETQKAIEHYEQSLRLAREMGDWDREATTSWHLGLTYEQLGDLGRAADLMRIRVDLYRRIGHRELEVLEAKLRELRVRLREQDER